VEKPLLKTLPQSVLLRKNESDQPRPKKYSSGKAFFSKERFVAKQKSVPKEEPCFFSQAFFSKERLLVKLLSSERRFENKV